MTIRWMTSLCLITFSLCSCARVDKTEPQTPIAAPPHLPGITIDRQAGHIDIDGLFAAQDAYLELVACTRGTKEHEAVVSITATAQHLHFALILLGAQPGAPAQWIETENGEPHGIDPTGSRVRVSLLVKQNNAWIETPLSRFIVDRDGQPIAGDTFVFGGSKITRKQNRTLYEADRSGNAIALVAFDDATLNWPTALTHANEHLEFYTHTAAIPAPGTPVKLRLRPLAGP